jgi:MFS family permease
VGIAADMTAWTLPGRRGVIAISITQIASWGSSYFVPAVFSTRMAADLGLPVAMVFGGITIMLLVGSLLGPAIGRRTDRIGPRDILIAGSLFLAAGMAALAFAEGLAGFVIAWALIGISMPMTLTQTPFAAVAQLMPHASRKALGLMTLLGSLCPPIFMPLLAAMETLIGWRGSCFLLAVLQIVVCVPLHWAIRVKPQPLVGQATGEGARPLVDSAMRRKAFWLMFAAFATAGYVSWGLPVQIVSVGQGYGLELALAVIVGSLFGPAQMVARMGETAFGDRLPILVLGISSATIMMIGCALPVIFGGGVMAFSAGVIGFGLGSGTMTIVRVVGPLAVFGREGYAEIMGKMNLPLNYVFATAPFVLAAASGLGGSSAVMALCSALMLVSIGVFVVLIRLTRS